ncbi:MAG: hypothetical protein Q4C42_11980 [Clostridia bacterium]|nr:hypothetical protein [Clostridia bacterium]
MNTVKRVILKLKSNPISNISLFLLYVIFSTFILLGIGINKAGIKEIEYYQELFNADITVTDSKADYNQVYEYNNLDYRKLSGIAESDEIEAFSVMSQTYAKAPDLKTITRDAQTEPTGENIKILAYSLPESISLFNSGIMKIDEGGFPDTDETDWCIISFNVLKKNKLNLNDTVSLQDSEGNEMVLKILGTFKVYEYNTADNSADNYENTVFVPTDTIFRIIGSDLVSSASFTVSNPAKVNSFTKMLREALGESAVFDIDNSEYRSVESSINLIIRLTKNVVSVLIILFVIILVFLFVIKINGSYHEIGILFGMGENKYKVIGGFMLESLVPIIMSVPASLGIYGQSFATVVRYIGIPEFEMVFNVNILSIYLLILACILIIPTCILICKVSIISPAMLMKNKE